MAYFKDAQEVYDALGKLFQLVPLTKSVFPRYKAQLEEQGRAGLIDA